MFRNTTNSLHKSRQIFRTGYQGYQKKKEALLPDQRHFLETNLKALDTAIVQGDRAEADRLARQLDEFNKSHFKKSYFYYGYEFVVAILVALVIATIVRQSWFEPYEIPTGSMRPTFKEQDHLIVTKTAFGVNIPLATDHFYFDPALVNRTGVIIWSGDGVPFLDSDSTFMGIFPYTKRYIKRCMGKPGDQLFFYGGKIYGMDAAGNDLKELRDDPHLERIEHVPFIQFDGRVDYQQHPLAAMTLQATFNHFNLPTGRLRFTRQSFEGEVFNGTEWIKDDPTAQQKPHSTIQTYSDHWGMRNYAVVRLLTPNQLQSIAGFDPKEVGEGELYLQLHHTPSLSAPSPSLSEQTGVLIPGYNTVIPLKKEHLAAIMQHMYTCRFIVKDGRAHAYRIGYSHPLPTNPSFPGVKDGTYEFYYGEARQVGWGAITYALPKNHPLYSLDPTNVQRLFNVGIEMDTRFQPSQKNFARFPNRYAYFRDGDLYLMGGKVMDHNDPVLKAFHQNEEKRESRSTKQTPYVAFKDYGPPLKEDGSLDQALIKTFGYRVPDGHYLMLGDNHAMSQDCRYFGAVPEANLQGSPTWIVWPPGSRWGAPNQVPNRCITTPALIVWSTAAIALLIWWLIRNYRVRKPAWKQG